MSDKVKIELDPQMVISIFGKINDITGYGTVNAEEKAWLEEALDKLDDKGERDVTKIVNPYNMPKLARLIFWEVNEGVWMIFKPATVFKCGYVQGLVKELEEAARRVRIEEHREETRLLSIFSNSEKQLLKQVKELFGEAEYMDILRSKFEKRRAREAAENTDNND